jgi:hypothetical protein
MLDRLDRQDRARIRREQEMQKKKDDQSRLVEPQPGSITADLRADDRGGSHPFVSASYGSRWCKTCGQDEADHVHDPPSDPVTDFEMAEAMRTMGGSFVSALAEAWFRADPINRAKILATWPEYCAEYRELAQLKRARTT